MLNRIFKKKNNEEKENKVVRKGSSVIEVFDIQMLVSEFASYLNPHELLGKFNIINKSSYKAAAIALHHGLKNHNFITALTIAEKKAETFFVEGKNKTHQDIDNLQRKVEACDSDILFLFMYLVPLSTGISFLMIGAKLLEGHVEKHPLRDGFFVTGLVLIMIFILLMCAKKVLIKYRNAQIQKDIDQLDAMVFFPPRPNLNLVFFDSVGSIPTGELKEKTSRIVPPHYKSSNVEYNKVQISVITVNEEKDNEQIEMTNNDRITTDERGRGIFIRK